LTNQNLTADDFLHALKKTGRADGGYTMFGTVKVFSNSLNVTSVHTVEQLGEVTARKGEYLTIQLYTRICRIPPFTHYI